MGIAPAFAIPRPWRARAPRPEEIDIWEVHEAYASVAVAILRELPNQLDSPLQGRDEAPQSEQQAVAIGHPFRVQHR